jgi:poly-gamma-glutamate capsule biosynthesis protein CapA/YwtB (metallophosphatase superfamily)
MRGSQLLTLEEIRLLLAFYRLTMEEVLTYKSKRFQPNVKRIVYLCSAGLISMVILLILSFGKYPWINYQSKAIETGPNTSLEQVESLPKSLPVENEPLTLRIYGEQLYRNAPKNLPMNYKAKIHLFTISSLSLSDQKVPGWIADFQSKGDQIILNLATNDAFVSGVEEVVEEMNRLQVAGVETIGIGRGNNGFKPYIFESSQGKVGVLSFSKILPKASWKPGENRIGVAHGYDGGGQIIRAVQEAKKQVDILIVMVHWGSNMAVEPDSSQYRLAQNLIDSGADLIVGNHPYRSQTVGQYKDKYIFYSLGQMTSKYKSVPQSYPFFLDVTIKDKTIDRFHAYPGLLEGGEGDFAPVDSQKQRAREYFSKLVNQVNGIEY